MSYSTHFKSRGHKLDHKTASALAEQCMLLEVAPQVAFLAKLGLPANLSTLTEPSSGPLYPPIRGKSTCPGVYCAVSSDGRVCGLAFKLKRDFDMHVRAEHPTTRLTSGTAYSPWVECNIQTYTEAKQSKVYFPVNKAQPKLQSLQVKDVANPTTAVASSTKTPHVTVHRLPTVTATSLLSLSELFANSSADDDFILIGSNMDVADEAGTSAKDAAIRQIEMCQLELAQTQHDLASKVHSLGESLAEKIPWLVRTGFAHHLEGLYDVHIKKAYAFEDVGYPAIPYPTTGHLYTPDIDAEVNRLVDALEDRLYEIYDRSKADQVETQYSKMRADILGKFSSTSIKVSPWNPHKFAATLGRYFKAWKGLIAYVWRWAYALDATFPGLANTSSMVKSVTLSPKQKTSLNNIRQILKVHDTYSKEKSKLLQDELIKLSVAIIEHKIGSSHHRSLLVSYCAILSRTQSKINTDPVANPPLATLAHYWHSPTNYNSNLSALIWVAQLLVLDKVVQDTKAVMGSAMPSLCGRPCGRPRWVSGVAGPATLF